MLDRILTDEEVKKYTNPDCPSCWWAKAFKRPKQTYYGNTYTHYCRRKDEDINLNKDRICPYYTKKAATDGAALFKPSKKLI